MTQVCPHLLAAIALSASHTASAGLPNLQPGLSVDSSESSSADYEILS
jgi:hypothetical protein